MISDLFQKFSTAFKKEVNEKYSGELESYQLLVKQAPTAIRKIIDGQQIKIEGSIGRGNNAYYPWLGLFDTRVSTGATNGFYIVFLFSDDYDHVYLTLNQGSTQQSSEEIQRFTDYVFKNASSIPGFTKGKLPDHSLVRLLSGSKASKGEAYESTNLFYKHYVIAEISEGEIVQDLKTLVDTYKKLASAYQKKSEMMPTVKPFLVHEFSQDLDNANLIIEKDFCYRFLGALISKPFVILTGLSGSGKTKLAQAFCRWLENSSQDSSMPTRYILTPVGSDWINREPILGYPNALAPGEYEKPDNGLLDLLIDANKPENSHLPFFIILDEMNLSHVERYFADFLSAMESAEAIPIHPESGVWEDSDIPAEIHLPDNLFIVGTVNIDETTYMFSPKVLDRAQVIEFHVTADEIDQFLDNPAKPDLNILKGNGAESASAFLDLARQSWDLDSTFKKELQTDLNQFFIALSATGAEFGYRTAFEITRFCAILHELTKNDSESWEYDKIVDAAVVQKLMPKLHGSRKKLEPVLNQMAEICLTDDVENPVDFIREFIYPDDFHSKPDQIRFPISLEKILRMKRRLEQEGFTSFAEA